MSPFAPCSIYLGIANELQRRCAAYHIATVVRFVVSIFPTRLLPSLALALSTMTPVLGLASSVMCIGISKGLPSRLDQVFADCEHCSDYAQLAEELGIGIWACRKTSPDWTVDGLTVAFMEMLGDNSRAAEMAKKAKAVGERARANRGRDVAAQEIAKLAATGF